MKQLGINVARFSSDDNLQQYNEIKDACLSYKNNPKLLYMTPEKIMKSESIMNLFFKMNLKNKLERFVIDEAHCVS